MAPPPVIKLVAGGTEAAANVNPQRDRMLTLGPTRVPPATWRFSGPPRPGKRRWNRPLAHVHPLRDNCIYRAWRNEPRATSQHPRICTRAHASQGTPTPVRHLRLSAILESAPGRSHPNQPCAPPGRGLYLRCRFPKSRYMAVAWHADSSGSPTTSPKRKPSPWSTPRPATPRAWPSGSCSGPACGCPRPWRCGA